LRLVLREGNEWEKRGKKNRRGNGGKISHSARPIKQNEPPLPRDFSPQRRGDAGLNAANPFG
jgi:hypothetical protein